MVIPFKVSGRSYTIPFQQIQDFPLKDALVNKLVEKYLDKTFPVTLSGQGEIIIELPKSSDELDQLNLNNTSKVSCTRHNFEKVVRIYANPKITMFELLDLECMITNARAVDENRRINQSPEDIFDGNPQFNFLRKSNYENFMEELAFYGVDSLFRSPLAEKGVDPEDIIRAFEKNLEPHFNKPHRSLRVMLPPASGEFQVKVFITQILALGGIFSGSSILQAALGEDWDEYKPNDLDVYVNESMLRGMLPLSNHGFKKYQPLEHQATRVETEIANNMKSEGKSEQEVKNAIGVPVSRIYRVMEEFEQQNEEILRKHLADWVCLVLGAESAIVTRPEQTEQYQYSTDIRYVIKIVMGSGLKIDFVVLRSTIPYHIDHSFDLEFCKIYYDGYSLHAINWESVINKCSLDRQREQLSYVSRINRYEKYLRRGFVVMAPDTNAYRQSIEPIRLPTEDDIDPAFHVIQDDYAPPEPFVITIP